MTAITGCRFDQPACPTLSPIGVAESAGEAELVEEDVVRSVHAAHAVHRAAPKQRLKDTLFSRSMTTTLTGKNQVTVPAEIARQFGLEPGSKLDWSAGKTPGTIVIQVQMSKRQMLDRVQEIGRTWKNRNLVEELIKEREKDMI